MAFRVISVRETELAKNKDRVAIARSTEKARISLGPIESKDIRGYTDREKDHTPTCIILQESIESPLPAFVDITPTVVHYKHKKNAGYCKCYQRNSKLKGSQTTDSIIEEDKLNQASQRNRPTK